MNSCNTSDVNYNGWYTEFIVGPIHECLIAVDASSWCRQNKNAGCEGGRERERAADKQGLQRVLASINQLRKEREEFAYPLPVWEREREKGEGGTESTARSPDTDGKGSERGISIEKKEKQFPEWLE